MTSCQEVRAAVMLRELPALASDPLIEAHTAQCAQCASDLAAVRTATTATADLLNGWSPLAEPAALAERVREEAIAWGERRARHWRSAWISLCAAAIAGWVLLVANRAAPIRAVLGFPDPPYRSIVVLKCLPPEAAARVAAPYLHSRGSGAIPAPPGVRSVTLQGHREEVAQADIAIAQLDGRLGPEHATECAR